LRIGKGPAPPAPLLSGPPLAGCYNTAVKTTRRLFFVGMMGTGVRVAVIYDKEGEAGFRRREAEVIEQVTALDNVVLATGGGVVLDPRNREHLQSRGFVIYLHAQPAVLWQRTRSDKSRPLLQDGDPRGRLEKLYAERDPLYREVADLVIDTGRQSVGSLLAQVLAKFGEACKLSA
jgi:shikimate kinase